MARAADGRGRWAGSPIRPVWRKGRNASGPHRDPDRQAADAASDPGRPDDSLGHAAFPGAIQGATCPPGQQAGRPPCPVPQATGQATLNPKGGRGWSGMDLPVGPGVVAGAKRPAGCANSTAIASSAGATPAGTWPSDAGPGFRTAGPAAVREEHPPDAVAAVRPDRDCPQRDPGPGAFPALAHSQVPKRARTCQGGLFAQVAVRAVRGQGLVAGRAMRANRCDTGPRQRSLAAGNDFVRHHRG